MGVSLQRMCGSLSWNVFPLLSHIPILFQFSGLEAEIAGCRLRFFLRMIEFGIRIKFRVDENVDSEGKNKNCREANFDTFFGT